MYSYMFRYFHKMKHFLFFKYRILLFNVNCTKINKFYKVMIILLHFNFQASQTIKVDDCKCNTSLCLSIEVPAKREHLWPKRIGVNREDEYNHIVHQTPYIYGFAETCILLRVGPLINMFSLSSAPKTHQ